MRLRALAALVILGLLSSSCAALNEASSSPTTTIATKADNSSALRRSLGGLIRAGVPGAVLIVVDAEGSDRIFTAGFADEAKTQNVAENSIFGIAAITDAFLAATFLRLEEEGVLSLSDSVDTWLPGQITNGDQITVNDLLRHTSGLAEWTGVGVRPPDGDDPGSRGVVLDECLAPVETDRQGIPQRRDETTDPKCRWTDAQVLALITPDEGDVETTPIRAWRHTTTNARVASLVLEAATGRTASELIAAFVTGRLELGSTSLPQDWDPGALPGRLATGYAQLDEDPELDEVGPYLPAGTDADLAMLSSARNIASFYRELVDGDLLQGESKRILLAALPTGTGAAQGLGVGYPLGESRSIIGNTGETLGYSAWAEHDLESSTTFVLLMNASGDQVPAAELAAVLSEASGITRRLQLVPSTGFGRLRYRDVIG